MALWETIAFEVLTLSICSGVIIAHRWTKKVTTTYWWWLGVSIAYLAFTIGITWWKHWNNIANFWSLYVPAQDYERMTDVSYALCTNMCYVFQFALPLSFIFDPTRKVARSMAPMASLASMMVLIVIIPFGFGGAGQFTLEYLILGRLWRQGILNVPETVYYAWSLFYSAHLFNLLFAIGAWLTTPRYGWKGTISVAGSYGILYSYVGIMTAVTGLIGQNSGISLYDFDKGNFAIVGQIFGGNLQLAQGFFFAFVITVMFIWTFLQDFAFKRGWYQFGNKKSGVWWKYWDYEHFAPDANEKDWGKFAKLLPKVRYNYI